ncbi:hypothetical protein RhiirA4_497243 [Rhizophagus irregularis]|uniref:Galactose oxidase n=2 Tax=Rhizophagus irregularis TaxID=588596 RepID=A0A2I1H1F2_9GLOM|nr:hypothetical protein RhiirA4_497243 [Rhizophagus irregularis]
MLVVVSATLYYDIDVAEMSGDKANRELVRFYFQFGKALSKRLAILLQSNLPQTAHTRLNKEVKEENINGAMATVQISLKKNLIVEALDPEIGGFGEKEGKEFFYLDVSSPFTTLKPSWDDLTDINTLEAHWGATSVNGGADNSSLILYGGMQYNKDSSHSNFPLIHIFDAQNNSWSVPEVPGQEQIFYLTGSGVIDHSGQMYTLEIIHQMMVVFDTIDLTLWKKSSINNIFMTFYVAVLLPDQNIIYFSDSDGADPNLSEVLLYNTIDDRWRVQETIGNIPSNRSDFSAVLALDGQRVIIFGGMNENTMELIPGEDALYILEMKNFEWYIPKVSGNFPARSNHKANIIGKYMVVTFGKY